MSCNCTSQATNAPVITPVLGAGSIDSPYYWQVNITQRLCDKTCVGNTPVFNPSFSVLGWTSVGVDQYMVTLQVEGVISYIPCGGDTCCTRSQLVAQTFSVPVASATAITGVTITKGTTINSVYAPACKTCSRSFVSETPITMTIS